MPTFREIKGSGCARGSKNFGDKIHIGFVTPSTCKKACNVVEQSR